MDQHQPPAPSPSPASSPRPLQTDTPDAAHPADQSPAVVAAREQLVQALASDMANSFLNDPEGGRWLVDCLRAGIGGFDKMSLTELLQAASDSGLDERFPDLINVLSPVALDDPEEGSPETGASPEAPSPPAGFKSVLQLTVLHERDVDVSAMSLSAIAYECGDGEFLGGELQVIARAALTREQLDQEACALGSDGTFFGEPEHLGDWEAPRAATAVERPTS